MDDLPIDLDTTGGLSRCFRFMLVELVYMGSVNITWRLRIGAAMQLCHDCDESYNCVTVRMGGV